MVCSFPCYCVKMYGDPRVEGAEEVLNHSEMTGLCLTDIQHLWFTSCPWWAWWSTLSP